MLHSPARGLSGVGISLAAGLALLAPLHLYAQLRPLEPAPFNLFDGVNRIAGAVGVARLADQRASLAGTEGTLWEAGNFSVAWRTGRVVIEAGGTVQRMFDEQKRIENPYPDVQPADDGHRNDSGDYRISTTVRLTPDRWPVTGTLRFGTRLPTTDNTTGLDRDAVDFFATVGGASVVDHLGFSGEAGLGIHSTREQRFEQDDLLLYAIAAEYDRWMVVPSVRAVGQIHGNGHAEIRGVEDLGELRLGLRAGRRNWIRGEFVRGYETFSPSSGFIVTAGILR